MGFGCTVVRPRRSLFLVSHMRSYSSLMGHILGSHESINGYAELHNEYSNFTHLYRMRAKVAMMGTGRLKGPYVLDKVLFNRWTLAPEILSRNEVYTIFFVRDPEATIPSLVSMAGGPKNADVNWKADVEKATEYYVERVDNLVEIAATKPKHSAFFVAERLIDRTDETLAMLTSYLGLKSPLKPDYQKFENTQKRGFGDPGKYIATGTVVAERREHTVEVPPSLMAEARAAYERAVPRLAELCQVTLPGDHA